MGQRERMYCCQPLYHIDGRLAVLCAVLSGGSVVLEKRFTASRFWSGIRAMGATRFFYVGSMLWMLHKQPALPDDASQPARIGIGSSTPLEIHREFEARFSTGLIDTFGMTEGALLTGVPVRESRPGTMGKPLTGASLALLDDGDRQVPPGTIGQVALRPDQPDVLPLGYWNKPEVTVSAWRNLWFHTGDLAREDGDGYWTYVGRMKDVIRRRGENISAWEVEQAFLQLDAVLEVAALGVPSSVGEEDLAVLVVTHPSHQPVAAQLCSDVARNVPSYMVPRFVEFVDELPKTASHRIEKGKVRERGITNAAWDAVAAGWSHPASLAAGSEGNAG
jgi:crotonobetaine/carnitine-CoA ligase